VLRVVEQAVGELERSAHAGAQHPARRAALDRHGAIGLGTRAGK
jgi:hypothetical protein